MSRAELIPIDRIVAMLAARAGELARELLPNGYRDRQDWRVGSVSGEKGSSLGVYIGPGPKAGIWGDLASSDHGDALDLVAQVACNGNKVDAIKWAKAWLGLDGADPDALRRSRAAAERAEAAAEEHERRQIEDAAKRRNGAFRVWLEAAPAIAGTPVERYLAGRGIDLRRFDFPLGALRAHPGLWDKYTRRHWPAMAAVIVGADGKMRAVHRTFLEVLRDGSVRKAPIVNEKGKPAAKRVLGDYAGGTIRLWRGIAADPETGEIKQARRLAQCKQPVWVDLTEGIEDGLSVAQETPEARVLAGVSLTNLARIVLPPIVEGVYLWKQNDPEGSKAAIAFEDVVQHWIDQGKRVRLPTPPEGTKDVNELLQAQQREGCDGDQARAG